MGDSPYKPLANILNKAQGRVCKETGEEIDVGGDVVKVREHCDRLRAENEEMRERIAELAQNDRRYMWIRDGGYQIIGEDRGSGPEWPDAADVDRLVDAQLGARDER